MYYYTAADANALLPQIREICQSIECEAKVIAPATPPS